MGGLTELILSMRDEEALVRVQPAVRQLDESPVAVGGHHGHHMDVGIGVHAAGDDERLVACTEDGRLALVEARLSARLVPCPDEPLERSEDARHVEGSAGVDLAD